MSSAVGSTSAAWSRPFLFDDEIEVEVRPFSDAKKPAAKQALALTTPASRLEIRPAPAMASSGIPALDALTGGLPRGCLTEICGPASSGRTTVLLATLAAATQRGEFCALIDARDSLDPRSAAFAAIDFDRLLWVRCNEEGSKKNHILKSAAKRTDEHRLEQLLRATDLLLESGGFGLIILDLADLPPQSARRIPLTTWFRFRRAVEHKSTILLTIEKQPIAGSCSSLLLQLAPHDIPSAMGNEPTHAHLLTKLQIRAEQVRSRLNRKPSHSITFESKTAWAG